MSFPVIHAKTRSQWITLFEIASQWSTSQVYWMTLVLISNIANYLKYNYFWDCDGIDNVTLRLWKFSDFCSRHIVGVAGDDIMFHILVCVLYLTLINLISIASCKTSVTPLLTHWSYCSLAPSHQYYLKPLISSLSVSTGGILCFAVGTEWGPQSTWFVGWLRGGLVHVVHYSDVIMGAIESQITNLTIVYLMAYSEANDDI